MSADDLSRLSLRDLFEMEAHTQSQVLITSLLALERNPAASDRLEAAMRAAHSLKGAASTVGLEVAVRVAHAMEDMFVAAQQGRLTLTQSHIDVMLDGVDLLTRIATADEENPQPQSRDNPEVDAFLSALQRAATTTGALPARENVPGTVAAAPAAAAHPATGPAADGHEHSARVLRVTADSLNRLLGLAGESLVESRRFKPFADLLLQLKWRQNDARRTLDRLREMVSANISGPELEAAVAAARSDLVERERMLSERLVDFEQFDRRSTNLSHRLYDEARAIRMRPFGDGVEAFPRLVRDVARSLGKEARLEIAGEDTQVDRDIVVTLEAPLGHLLRNAVDHGLESPEERLAAGKPAVGTVTLDARHSGGALQVTVSDDGRGIDPERLRRAIVARRLSSEDTAANLTDAELLEFLFLPGFSLKETVTDLSGRGVGLDVVRDMVKQVRGTVRVSSQAGHGTRFQMILPVTLSIVRTLLVGIGGEPYAFPLAAIDRVLKVPASTLQMVEGRQHVQLDDRSIGLITAHQIFELDAPSQTADEVLVVVIGDARHTYGVIVDQFLGEQELVVQPLDPQLGKIKDISAAALMEDGSPVLIVDIEDLIRSVEKIVAGGRVEKVHAGGSANTRKAQKRVLVVDDSLTVRELERKLLANHGYEVDVAVDGMDGWNAVRTGRFDLVITDIDMPRIDGIELVTLINRDPHLKSLPVIVVSYKDREEDRRRGLEAGASHYLTKSSFHDESLVQAVADLIGEAGA
jgi:two-component system, chemotaxis family, sensor histidine kinase and response regulator WspE